mgnify:CR=1 FL=1
MPHLNVHENVGILWPASTTQIVKMDMYGNKPVLALPTARLELYSVQGKEIKKGSIELTRDLFEKCCRLRFSILSVEDEGFGHFVVQIRILRAKLYVLPAGKVGWSRMKMLQN